MFPPLLPAVPVCSFYSLSNSRITVFIFCPLCLSDAAGFLMKPTIAQPYMKIKYKYARFLHIYTFLSILRQFMHRNLTFMYTAVPASSGSSMVFCFCAGTSHSFLHGSSWPFRILFSNFVYNPHYFVSRPQKSYLPPVMQITTKYTRSTPASRSALAHASMVLPVV